MTAGGKGWEMAPQMPWESRPGLPTYSQDSGLVGLSAFCISNLRIDDVKVIDDVCVFHPP